MLNLSSQGLKINSDNSNEQVELPKADILIVGAGLSGAVLAHLSKELLNQTSVVIDKRNHIAGNTYDFKNELGILESLYGPHMFHTDNPRVWRYMHQFTKFIPYEHRTSSVVDTQNGTALVPVPVNIDSVNSMVSLGGKFISTADQMYKWLESVQVKNDNPQNSEEVGLARVGEELYNTLFKPYTIKQWGREPRELDASVLSRIDVRSDFDDRYFPHDSFQAQPAEGFTKMVENMFHREGVVVFTNTDFFQLNDITKRQYKKIYFCGPIDQYFEKSGLGKLEYRSLYFKRHESLEDDYVQATSQQNFPSLKYPFTRITEYKHIRNDLVNGTVWLEEFSSDKGEPYYPVPNFKNQALFEKYKELATKAETESATPTFFVGRLANYKYFNMDQAILNAIEQWERINPVDKETLEKMYGGVTQERANSFFHKDPAHPAFTFVIHQDCNIDIYSISRAFSSICSMADKRWTQVKLFRSCKSAMSWKDTHSKTQEDLAQVCGGGLFRVDDVPTEPETTANEAFVTHFLSSTGANAVTDLNVFLSGQLDKTDGVQDKIEDAVQKVMASTNETGYAARHHREVEVRGAGHFQRIVTHHKENLSLFVDRMEEKMCKSVLLANKIGEGLPEEICSPESFVATNAFVVTDAALRRSIARHRTFLWNLKKSEKVNHKYMSLAWPSIIDSRAKIQKRSNLQMAKVDSHHSKKVAPRSSDEGDWMQWTGLGEV